MLPRWRVLLAIISVVYLLANPAGAARLVHKSFAEAGKAGHSLSVFVDRL